MLTKNGALLSYEVPSVKIRDRSFFEYRPPHVPVLSRESGEKLATVQPIVKHDMYHDHDV